MVGSRFGITPWSARRGAIAGGGGRCGRGDVLGSWVKLLQAWRSQLGWLPRTHELTLIEDGQTAIHAVAQFHGAAGKGATSREGWQGQDMTKEGNGVVPGDGTPVGEADALVGLGSGQARTIS